MFFYFDGILKEIHRKYRRTDSRFFGLWIWIETSESSSYSRFNAAFNLPISLASPWTSILKFKGISKQLIGR